MYIILAIILILILLSITMQLPYKGRRKRDKLYLEKSEKENIIIGDNKHWMLWIIRGILLILMCVIAEQVYIACENPKEYLIAVILFCFVFILNYVVFLPLDREYYFSEHGLWIKMLKDEPIPYNEIVFKKIWMTSAPFSGCNGDLKIRFAYNGKKYTAKIIGLTDDDGETDSSRHDTVLAWIDGKTGTQTEKTPGNFVKKTGEIFIAVGIVMVLLFGFQTIQGIGITDDVNKATVAEHEQAIDGAITSIYKGKDENLYAFFNDFACINVYNKQGEFLYAYRVPKGKTGGVEYAVEEPNVYIKNRDAIVYIFSEKTFVKELPANNLEQSHKIRYIKEETGLNYISEIKTPRGSFAGDSAIIWVFIGIVLIVMGSFIYNKGKYKIVT